MLKRKGLCSGKNLIFFQPVRSLTSYFQPVMLVMSNANRFGDLIQFRETGDRTGAYRLNPTTGAILGTGMQPWRL